MEITSSSIGNALVELRNIRKLSQRELAEQVKLSITFISKLERGERAWLSKKHIEAICMALDIPISFFFVLAEDDASPVVKKLKEMVYSVLANAPEEHL